ncbi:MAG: hypothetical protein J6F30_11600, partial [Cellulosilyticum sp.]|nr:hypothetical protein [Cellulosilyticum sp.]
WESFKESIVNNLSESIWSYLGLLKMLLFYAWKYFKNSFMTPTFIVEPKIAIRNGLKSKIEMV